MISTLISPAAPAHSLRNLTQDSAGKTTVAHFMRFNKATATVPTTEFITTSVRHGQHSLQLWDVGGQEQLRPYWRHYLSGAHGVIFVADCADHARVKQMKDEFATVVTDPQLAEASVLVLANKQDLPGHMDTEQIKQLLELPGVMKPTQRWEVQPAVATSGEGLEDAFSWLCASMRAF